MEKLGEYTAIHDFWEDLYLTFADANFEPVRGKINRTEIKAANPGGLLVARLVRVGHLPSSLQVRKKTSQTSNTENIKLDFSRQSEVDDSSSYVGHLSLPKVPHQESHGIYVIETADIPRPARAELNKGVELLIKHHLE